MTPLVPLAIFGWIPVTLMLFALLPPRRAAVVALVGGWLFLPVAGFKVSGIPAYDKSVAATLPVLLGALLFDTQRLLGFRLKWWDVPMLVLCLCPMATSISTDKGVYDGTSAVLSHVLLWGLPYLVGRIFFTDLASMKELAMGVLVGAIVYVPLCLLEVRISPQLHRAVYGFYQNSFLLHVRYGGYRPMVFMNHGLMVGFWMAMGTVVCAMAWLSRSVRHVLGVPIAVCLIVLVMTTILCKAVGAIAIMGVGLVAVFVVRRRPWPIVLILAAIPLYVTVRASGLVAKDSITSLVALVVDAERLQSLQGRMTQEDLFGARALQRPVFGWSGWDFFPRDEAGKPYRGVDALWTIMLGAYGLVGLTSFLLAMLVPIVRFMRCYPVRFWRHAEVAPGGAMALVLLMWVCDSLLNGMPTPIYPVLAGALGATAGLQRKPHRSGRPMGDVCLARGGEMGGGARVRVRTPAGAAGGGPSAAV